MRKFIIFCRAADFFSKRSSLFRSKSLKIVFPLPKRYISFQKSILGTKNGIYSSKNGFWIYTVFSQYRSNIYRRVYNIYLKKTLLLTSMERESSQLTLSTILVGFEHGLASSEYKKLCPGVLVDAERRLSVAKDGPIKFFSLSNFSLSVCRGRAPILPFTCDNAAAFESQRELQQF